MKNNPSDGQQPEARAQNRNETRHLAGIPNPTMATTKAVTNPKIAAQWAFILRIARVPNNTTIGKAAHTVESATLLNGFTPVPKPSDFLPYSR